MFRMIKKPVGGQFDTSRLDNMLLDEQGRVRILPAKALSEISEEDVRVWCHVRAIYLLPSLELIEWLQGEIEGLNTIEIGAGNGCLGRALGIKTYDNMMQRDIPEVVDHYRLLRQPTIKYGSDVDKMDANRAVKTLKPECVVGSWITHQWLESEPEKGGNMYGPDECKIIRSVKKYIHIGAESVHRNKRALKLDHTFKSLEGLAFGHGTGKRVWIWSKDQ